MDQIGDKTIDAIGGAVADVLGDYRDAINAAYLKVDKKLKLTVTIDIEPHPDGNQCDVGLSFVRERIKDSVTRIVKEHQMEMFEGGGDK